MNKELQKTIDSLKANGHSLRRVTVSGKAFIIRSFNREEFRRIQEMVEELAEGVRSALTKKYSPEFDKLEGEDKESQTKFLELQETMQAEMEKESKKHLETIDHEVLKLAVVDPSIDSLDQLAPGAIQVLRDQVMLLSGFDDSPEVEDL